MPRRMTANLHIAPNTKNELDSIIPESIDNSPVTYDDFLNAVITFLRDFLGYDEHDIISLIIDYKKSRLEKQEIEIVNSA